MHQDLFEGALALLLERINERGTYNAYDALREYIDGQIIDELEDATDEQIESFIFNLFEPFSQFLEGKSELPLNIDSNLNVKIDSYSKNKSTQSEFSSEKVTFNFEGRASDLTKEDAIKLEKSALRYENLSEYFKAFDFFSILYEFYTEVEPNRDKSLAMLKKKSLLAIQLSRVDSFRYLSDLADRLSLLYKHDEAAKQYEKAYSELSNLNPSQVTNLHLKKVTMLRKARLQYHTAGDNKNASRLFVLENEEERLRTKSKSKLFYKCLSNYGESPTLVAGWILGIILLWASFYYAFDINIPSQTTYICSNEDRSNYCVEDSNSDIEKANILTYVYFSTVTFTTLGYGDYSPLEGWSRFFASIQAILGLILSSLFIVTFVRRFSR